MDLLPVLGAILLGAAIVVGVFFLARGLATRQAQKDQSGLPAQWEAREDGGRHELKFRPATRGKHAQPSLLSLRVPTASRIDLQITRETWFDRFCKSLGIAQEFQTGDRDFDAAWYLRGEVDSRLGLALRHGEVRGQLRTLLASGFTALRVDAGHLQVDWTGYDPARDPLPGAPAAQQLAAIAAALPSGGSAQAPRQYAVSIALWLVVLALGAAYAAGIDYPPVRAWDLWRLVLPTALLAWLAFAWISAFALRGRSRSHDQWLVLVLAALLGCTIGARGLLGWWNGSTDASPVVVHEAPVTALWSKRHKKRTSWWLAIPDWRREHETLDYQISRAQFESLREGASRVIVSTRAGALGVEWQTQRRIVP